jgi:excinuclease ABC subunit C
VTTAKAVLDALGVGPESSAPTPVIGDDQSRASG